MADGILNPIEQLEADFDFDVYTKQEVDALLDEKADKSDTYTKTETDALLNDKADADSVYTKTETDTLLSAKADKSTTLAGYGITDAYTKTQTDNLLNGKADADSVYTKSEIDTKIPNTVGSTTKPTYVNGGVLTECTYELNKTVPANAVFTDTTYTAGNGLNLNGTSFSTKAGTNVTVDGGGINVNGNGAVASADSGLISGGTAYTELRPTLDGTWVKNAQTTAINLQKLEGGIEYLYGLLSHQYDQLKKYINGNYYDYDTDNNSKYVKNIPQGAMPYASLDSIGGKTIVWNQLVDSGTTTVNTISGHKYYTLINGTASIVTSDGTAISVVDDTADMVCDLTLMMGSGNEFANTSDFTAVFPATHYSYNAGTLLSAGVTEVVSKGKNLVKVYPASEWTNFNTAIVSVAENEIKLSATGTSSSWAVNNQKINAKAGDVFSISCTTDKLANVRLMVFMFDKEDNKLTVSATGWTWNAYYKGIFKDNDSGTVTIPNNNDIQYIKVGFLNHGGAGDVMTLSNIQVEESATATSYSPYHAPIITPIPASIQALEGYGWSAGSVYNYIDYENKKFVKRVGAYTFDGTETWTYYPQENKNTFDSGNRFLTDVKKFGNGIMVDYTKSDAQYIASQDNLTFQFFNTPYISLRNDAYTDATTFASYMSGKTIYYELATPIETDISAYLTDDNLIEVESGGTLTFPNSNGTDYQIPVPSSETYMVDLQSAI